MVALQIRFTGYRMIEKFMKLYKGNLNIERLGDEKTVLVWFENVEKRDSTINYLLKNLDNIKLRHTLAGHPYLRFNKIKKQK